MGGGNGLKSHMAQQKRAAKDAEKGAGGGGAAGLKARTETAGPVCQVCRAAFSSAKMKQQLIDHHASKHSGKTFTECFPGLTV